MPKCHRMSLLQTARPRRSLLCFCLLRRVVGLGGPSKPPHVIVPMGPCGSCHACEAAVHWPVAGKRVLGSNATSRARARDQHGGDLKESASSPRLLPGPARVEMMQTSMFILVVISSAHRQTLVGVLVSPHENGTSLAKQSRALCDQAVVTPSATAQWGTLEPCLCRSWHSAPPCAGCCC